MSGRRASNIQRLLGLCVPDPVDKIIASPLSLTSFEEAAVGYIYIYIPMPQTISMRALRSKAVVAKETMHSLGGGSVFFS